MRTANAFVLELCTHLVKRCIDDLDLLNSLRPEEQLSVVEGRAYSLASGEISLDREHGRSPSSSRTSSRRRCSWASLV